MGFIANQRIKHRGKYVLAGEPIDLTKDERKELPAGSVSETDDAPVIEPPVDDAERAARLNEAVKNLAAKDFKKDGNIRADSLKMLTQQVGFDVTAEEVATVKTALSAPE